MNRFFIILLLSFISARAMAQTDSVTETLSADELQRIAAHDAGTESQTVAANIVGTPGVTTDNSDADDDAVSPPAADQDGAKLRKEKEKIELEKLQLEEVQLKLKLKKAQTELSAPNNIATPGPSDRNSAAPGAPATVNSASDGEAAHTPEAVLTPNSVGAPSNAPEVNNAGSPNFDSKVNPEVSGYYVQTIENYSEFHPFDNGQYIWALSNDKDRLDLLKLTEAGFKVDKSYPLSPGSKLIGSTGGEKIQGLTENETSESELIGSTGDEKAVWLQVDKKQVFYLDTDDPPKLVFSLDNGAITSFLPSSDGTKAWIFCNWNRSKNLLAPQLFRVDGASGQKDEIAKDTVKQFGGSHVELVNGNNLVFLADHSGLGKSFMKLSHDGQIQDSEIFHHNSVVTDPDHSIWIGPGREDGWFESDTAFPSKLITLRYLDDGLGLKKFLLSLESDSSQIKVIPLGNQQALVLDSYTMYLLDAKQDQSVSLNVSGFSPESGQFLVDQRDPEKIWFYSSVKDGDVSKTRLWLYAINGSQIQSVFESQPLSLYCLSLMPGLEDNSVWISADMGSSSPNTLDVVSNTGLYLFQSGSGLLNADSPLLPNFGTPGLISGGEGQYSLFKNNEESDIRNYAAVYKASPAFFKDLYLKIGNEKLSSLSDTHSLDIDLSQNLPWEVGFDFSGEGPVYFSNGSSFQLSLYDRAHPEAPPATADLMVKTPIAPPWKLEKEKPYDLRLNYVEDDGTQFSVTWHDVAVQYPWYESAWFISLLVSMTLVAVSLCLPKFFHSPNEGVRWLPVLLQASGLGLVFHFSNALQKIHLDPLFFFSALGLELAAVLYAGLVTPDFWEYLMKLALYDLLGQLVLSVPFVRRYQWSRISPEKRPILSVVTESEPVVSMQAIRDEEEIRKAKEAADRLRVEEERKEKEKAEIRNRANALMASAEKALWEYGVQIDREIKKRQDERTEAKKKIQEKFDELKQILSSEDLVKAAEKALKDYDDKTDREIQSKLGENIAVRSRVEEKMEALKKILAEEDMGAVQKKSDELDGIIATIAWKRV